MKKHAFYGCGALLGLLVAGLAGCASNPPRELVDARSAYRQAQNGPGASYAQTDIYEAKKALDAAEQKFDDDGNERATRDLAYVAQRKSLSARAKGETYVAIEQQKMAQAEIQRDKELHAQQLAAQNQQVQEQLSQSKEAWGKTAQMLESERQARAAAEERTRQMLSQIEGLKAQETERGTVLTLSGSVLFASGKSELLPTAQRRLDQAAEALKLDDRQITIVGHTDATGSDDKNMELSQRRAEAVSRYLVTHGVPQDRVTSEGAGETQPIADNKSAEGRANNRRVEIVLNKEGGAGTVGTPNQQGANKVPSTDTSGTSTKTKSTTKTKNTTKPADGEDMGTKTKTPKPAPKKGAEPK